MQRLGVRPFFVECQRRIGHLHWGRSRYVRGQGWGSDVAESVGWSWWQRALYAYERIWNSCCRQWQAIEKLLSRKLMGSNLCFRKITGGIWEVKW